MPTPTRCAACTVLRRGDLPDGVSVQVWPSRGTINRLGPVVTRAVALGVRSARAWPERRAPKLADYLAREGLASLAVAARFPDLPNPWAAPYIEATDWDSALADIVSVAGVGSYADLPVNVYSTVTPAGNVRLPLPVVPDAAEADYSSAVLGADLRTADSAWIDAYLYGDAVVTMTWHPPAGMSPFAGIATAHAALPHVVRRRGIDLLEAMGLAPDDLLDGAFAGA